MTLKIIGAGLAGLLAARMLQRRNPVVIEAQAALPNNHSAVLRFRSSIVGDTLGIPFRRVSVIKSSIPWLNPVADALAYADKCHGTLRTDRSIVQTSSVVDRWIAPPDLIARMAEGLAICFSKTHDFSSGEKVISTIPMPVLAGTLGYEHLTPADFTSSPGTNVSARIRDCDAYVSVYVPDPGFPFSRISITGDELIVEIPGSEEHSPSEMATVAGRLLGIDRERLSDFRSRPSAYAKIVPIEEGARREFIYWASTVAGRAHSLGRFATWRPGLLLDDLVQDVRIIDRLLDSRSPGYDAERMRREK